MYYRQKCFIFGILMLVLSVSAYGQEITKEQIKGQDEQVQNIKSDVLAISAELKQLEEKLCIRQIQRSRYSYHYQATKPSGSTR
jgi:cell division protein FtsB